MYFNQQLERSAENSIVQREYFEKTKYVDILL